MAEQQPAQRGGRGGRGGQSFGGGRGGAPGGAPGGAGGRPTRGGAGGRRGGAADWKPLTKLGRLVQANEIKSFEQIFEMSIPIKEPEIVKKISDNVAVAGASATGKGQFVDEVMKVKPVQKQTKAGQRTRFKAWVLIGDRNGHLGLGQKSHKEVQVAIKGAMAVARLNLIPIRLGYWGNKIGAPETVPFKVTGKNGSVSIRLIPAPKGTGIVGAPTSKKVLMLAGVKDCYTASIGCTKTMGNFIYATFNALSKTYKFLTPDLWGMPTFRRSPLDASDEAKKKATA